MKTKLLMAAMAGSVGLSILGGLFAADPVPPVRAAAEAAEKAKVEKYLAALKESDPARAKAAAEKWDKIKDKPFDAENDFILDSLADRYPALGDALDLMDGGAYTNAARKLNDLLAAANDPYLEAHVRYLLARIKFHEGDWPGAARELGEVLDKHAARMTLEHEAFFYRARALANVAPSKEERKAVGKTFAEFLEKYPFSKQRYLAAAADLAQEVAKTLPVIRSEGLTKVNGGPEELPNFAKDLRNIEKRISVPLRDTGKTTQTLQADALAYLDNLIDKAEQQQNQQQQQQQKKDQDDQQKKDQQDQKDQKSQQGDNKQQQQDDPQQQKKAEQARKDSQLPKLAGKAAGSIKDIEALRRGNFGTLPPEEIQKILLDALKSGKIPEKYARALELYSEELGGKINKKK